MELWRWLWALGWLRRQELYLRRTVNSCSDRAWGGEGVASPEGACSLAEQTGSEDQAHLPRVRMPEARGRHHLLETAFAGLVHVALAKLGLQAPPSLSSAITEWRTCPYPDTLPLHKPRGSLEPRYLSWTQH